MICTVLTEKHVRVTACTARMPVTHVFQCISKLIPSIITADLLNNAIYLFLPYKVVFLPNYRPSLEKIIRQMQRFQLNFPFLVVFGWLFHKTYATLCTVLRVKRLHTELTRIGRATLQGLL